MDLWRLRLVVFSLVFSLAGCETGGSSSAPIATAGIPDLHGTWTGTWGGTPLTLVIREREASGGDGGIYVGPWQVAGRQSPTVSGIITFTRRGDAVSTGMHGWLRQSGGLRLVIEANPSDGRQELVLNVDGDRLTGTGTSSFRWGPQGTVELARSRRSARISPGSVRLG